MLFGCAAFFSFSYITLETGVVALILFGSVQISIVCINFFRGNRLNLFEWLGLLLACFGLVCLVVLVLI
jgi:drug/metabolite transporter (DMT)-like permease